MILPVKIVQYIIRSRIKKEFQDVSVPIKLL